MPVFLLPFIILASQASHGAKLDRPSSFVLYFQPLFELPHHKTAAYIKELHLVIAGGDSAQFEQLLKVKDRNSRSKALCHPTLYFNRIPLPANKKPSRYCLEKALHIPVDFFQDPVFKRIEWNKLSLKINHFCNKKIIKICRELSLLHNKCMQEYLNFISQEKLKFKEKKPPRKKQKTHSSGKN